MAATGISGIDIRSSATRILFRAALVDVLEQIVTSGTVTLYIYELQDDGTLKSYDFNDNTFKTTALTTETVNMTHRTGNNSNTNTGIWTYALTTISGFTAGAIYFAQVECDGASPYKQTREFQYSGGFQSDTVKVAGIDIQAKGAVTAGSSSTVIKTTGMSPSGAVANQFMGRSLYFDSTTTTAALRGLVCKITASSNAANPDLTVEMADATALPATPASGDTFVIC